jgi:hypothetical protein
MRKTRILLALLSLLLVVAACDKRYEDGPAISFVKAKNRLCGLWRIDKVYTGDSEIPGLALDTLKVFDFSIFMNSGGAFFLQIIDTTSTTLAESLIRTDDRLTQLTFYPEPILGYENPFLPLQRNLQAMASENVWTITRLKRDELWMRTLSGSEETTLHFALITDYQNL